MRTKANAIRQQMLQNSQNWHTAGTQAERDYLHQQNLELNRILSQYAGGVESGYDPATGRWTTENADLGYGDIDPYDRANAKRLYGVTDAELDAYLRNTDRYFNYAQQHPLSLSGPEWRGKSGQWRQQRLWLWLWQRLRLRRFQLRRVWIWRIWLQRTFRAARRLAQCGAGPGGAADRLCNGAGRRGAGTRAGGCGGTVSDAAGSGRKVWAERDGQCGALCRAARRPGRIGLAQYNAVQNAAEENRLAVDAAQIKMATDTDRQIEDLRTQGEFAKANQVLEISQAYLQQLMSARAVGGGI